jgi:hypothetical protein
MGLARVAYPEAHEKDNVPRYSVCAPDITALAGSQTAGSGIAQKTRPVGAFGALMVNVLPLRARLRRGAQGWTKG